jgi:hypothetical protein
MNIESKINVNIADLVQFFWEFPHILNLFLFKMIFFIFLYCFDILI